MSIIVKAKPWGNSLGIIIPSEAVERLNIKPNETLVVNLQKKGNVLTELFGAFQFKKPTSQLIKEAQVDLNSKWIR